MRFAFRNIVGISACLLAIPACATGGDVTPRGGDGSAMDGGRTEADAETGVCDPLCEVGEMCQAGTCVPAEDADGDGRLAEFDCDDSDPTVGATLEQECAGTCAPGIEVCTDGVWGPCSAPTSCDCEVGEPARMIPCGSCGTQRLVCTAGVWENDGTCTGAGPCSDGEIGTGGACGNCGVERRQCDSACTWGAWACEGEGVCAAGATESEMQPCGACGTGMQTRSRTCDAACGWGPWGAWGTCSGGGTGVCTPGQTQMEERACGNCGRQTRTRTCSSTTCDWGAWSSYGTCTGQGACAPGSARPCPNGDSCGVQACTSSCTWPTACTPNAGSNCMRIRPGTTGPQGNNYRCCPLSGGDQGWQFCLPPDAAGHCFWSTSCQATTAC